ncbi:hypothetical protein IVU49_04675 [Salmonella enterica subsp. enterica serovar Worthington]|nr:hypothetical protein [Salmonella enterica subsp. enterica serovar Worthington]
MWSFLTTYSRASGGWYPRGRHLDWSNDMTMRGRLYRKVNVRELLLNTVSRIERKSLIRFDQRWVDRLSLLHLGIR